jgi:hypothetical protein
MDDDGKVIPLFPDDDGGATLAKWAERLAPYLDERAAIEAARHREMPARPWPDRDNPMLGYLINRASEYLEVSGIDETLVWLAVHAWFEGALDERHQQLRNLTD